MVMRIKKLREAAKFQQKQVAEEGRMDKLMYTPKSELVPIAQEVLDLLRTKELPIWQIKEVLAEASRIVEWEKLK